MKKRYGIVLIVAILLVVGGYVTFQHLQRQAIEDVIRTEYDGPIDIAPGQDCEICDDTGCYILESCWIANVTTEDGIIEVIIDDGVIVDDREASPASPASEDSGVDPDPPPDDCTYRYTEQQGTVETTYTNTGCENPTPTCGTDNDCKSCADQSSCLGIIDIRVEGNLNTTIFHITSTQYSGLYTHATGHCVIDDSVIPIYNNFTDYNTCLEVVTSHVECLAGICDFI